MLAGLIDFLQLTYFENEKHFQLENVKSVYLYCVDHMSLWLYSSHTDTDTLKENMHAYTVPVFPTACVWMRLNDLHN